MNWTIHLILISSFLALYILATKAPFALGLVALGGVVVLIYTILYTLVELFWEDIR